MREKLRIWFEDHLFRNSFYLMLNTGLQAVLGFFFWLISARLFTPDQIGVAASLISAMTLISYLSLLGFNSTFIRVLPGSKNRDNEINTGLILSISAAVIIGTGYVLLVPYIAPKLDIIHANIFYAIGFIVLVALAAINLLTDSIFIAFRGAWYNLLIDGGIMGTIKMFLPFAFAGLGAYGAFAASGSAAAVAMVASIIFLAVRFDYKPRLSINKQALREMFSYSSSNYIGNLLNIAPVLLLPIIVIDHLGSAQAGYYYLAFTVANLLYAVVFSVSQSLFAEGSYGNIPLLKLVKRSAIIITAIMVPAGLILAGLGPYVLDAFGKSYSMGGSQAIIAFALAAPAVVAYILGGVVLRITNQIRAIILMNVVYAATICTLATLWVDRGLVWVAVAWAIGNVASAAVAFISLWYNRHTAHQSSFSKA